MRPGFYRDWFLGALALSALLFAFGCGGGGGGSGEAKSSEFLVVEQLTGLRGNEPPVVYESAVRCAEGGLLCCLASYRARRTADQPPDAVSYFLWTDDQFKIVLADGDSECSAYEAQNHNLQVEMCNALRWQAGDFRDCWADREVFDAC